jgi:hypothetical protein
VRAIEPWFAIVAAVCSGIGSALITQWATGRRERSSAHKSSLEEMEGRLGERIAATEHRLGSRFDEARGEMKSLRNDLADVCKKVAGIEGVTNLLVGFHERERDRRR